MFECDMRITIDVVSRIRDRARATLDAEIKECDFHYTPIISEAIVRHVLEAAKQEIPELFASEMGVWDEGRDDVC